MDIVYLWVWYICGCGLGGVLKACTEQICKLLVDNEALLNELDRGSGDGDCGSTLKSGAQGESHRTT